MVEDKQCLVQWHDYNTSIQSAMENFRSDKEFLDCTLACDGHTIRAHKIILAASSQYFRQVFKDFPCKHPTIILEGIRIRELLNIIHFMYSGKALVEENALVPLLIAAAYLSVDGLEYVTGAMLKSAAESQLSGENESNSLQMNGGEEPENTAVHPNENDLTKAKEEFKCSEVGTNCLSTFSHFIPKSHKRNRNNIPDESSVENDSSKRNFSNCTPKSHLSLKPAERNEIYFSKNDYEEKENCHQNGMEDKASSTPNKYLNGHAINGEIAINYTKTEFQDVVNSPENADFDDGPPALPPNHPAVLAAALTSVADNGMPSGVNYADLLAARSHVLNTGITNGHSAFVGSVNSAQMPVWTNHDISSTPIRQDYIHPIGHSLKEMQDKLDLYQRKLAFHEPRPCPTCKRMYRDAATLRTHITIMHFEGQQPFSCTCGSLFRTKYDMYQHKKNGHR